MVTRVLVIGGYGFFGRRLVQRLSRHDGIHVQVAGRSLDAARSAVRELQERSRALLEPVAIDSRDPLLEDALRSLAPGLVIDTSGPFQGSDYRVPLACIGARVHYADLADDSDHVAAIGALNEAALSAGIMVTSGASSVPALSCAAADFLAKDLSTVRSIDIGISPGNRSDRGLATVRSVLSYCGKPLPTANAGEVHGWVGARRHVYPQPVGTRLLSPCDVPDLRLLPRRYAGNPAVRFGAGLELEFLHRGMNVLGWISRKGIVRDWSRHAGLLKQAADIFKAWGSDAGAMHVRVQGIDRRGQILSRTWQLVATNGEGPFVPTLAAAALVRKVGAAAVRAGAYPCVGVLGLEDFTREMEGLALRTEIGP